MMRKVAGVFLSLLAGALFAAEPGTKPAGTLMNFSVEASQSVPNDLAHATVFAEAAGLTPAEAATKVNAAMAQAGVVAKTFADIKTRSGSTWTAPVYGKTERTIDSWRMRSELLLESRNIGALGELVGKLQAGGLGISQIALQATAETRRKAEEQVTLDAVDAFQNKARLIASHFKKYYRIVRMNVDSGAGPVYPAARAAMSKMQVAAMPIESGESVVSVTVSGEIELVD